MKNKNAKEQKTKKQKYKAEILITVKRKNYEHMQLAMDYLEKAGISINAGVYGDNKKATFVWRLDWSDKVKFNFNFTNEI